MNTLAFIASLVSSLTWPAAVLVIVFLLRKPLRGLIPLLRRLKYGDLELDFEQRIEDLQEEVAEELAPAPATLGLPPSKVAEIAKVSPRSAVLESWREVESAAVELARQRGIPLPDQYSRRPFQVIRSLEKEHAISSSTSSAIHELRALRNEAVHVPDFSFDVDSALSYDAVARRVASTLRSSTGGHTGQGPL